MVSEPFPADFGPRRWAHLHVRSDKLLVFCRRGTRRPSRVPAADSLVVQLLGLPSPGIQLAKSLVGSRILGRHPRQQCADSLRCGHPLGQSLPSLAKPAGGKNSTSARERPYLSGPRLGT